MALLGGQEMGANSSAYRLVYHNGKVQCRISFSNASFDPVVGVIERVRVRKHIGHVPRDANVVGDRGEAFPIVLPPGAKCPGSCVEFHDREATGFSMAASRVQVPSTKYQVLG